MDFVFLAVGTALFFSSSLGSGTKEIDGKRIGAYGPRPVTLDRNSRAAEYKTDGALTWANISAFSAGKLSSIRKKTN